MANHQDIIGIVKDLQQRHRTQIKEHGCMSPRCPSAMCRLIRHYPAIAQALLIAVEALEKEQTHAEDCATGNDDTTCTCHVWRLEDALSRIRSL